MSRRARRAAWRALCLIGMAAAADAAHAELWSLDTRLESRAEVNDNYRLEPRASTVSVFALTGAVAAARQSERGQTRLAADLSLFETRPDQASQRRSESSVDVSHTETTPRDTLAGSVKFHRDSTLERRTTASEIGLGVGERRESSASASWSRLLSERTRLQLGLSAASTRFGREVTGAVDYRNASASGGMDYQLGEADRVGLQLSRSAYRTAGDLTRSNSTGWSLSWQHGWTERSSGSLSVGRYRTDSRAQQAVLVCPLPISFCDAGVVSPVVALRQGESQGSGAQFEMALRHELDTVTGVTLTASRQLSPSGAGAMSRNDALSLAAHTAWSDTLSASASAALSRSSFIDGAQRAEPRLRVLNLGVSKRLRPGLACDLNLRQTRSDDPRSGIGATANAVTVVLRLQDERILTPSSLRP